MIEEKQKSDGGIIMQVGEDDAMNTTDVATKRLQASRWTN
jgi:hypothetical protein